MPVVTKSVLVPFSAQRMFALVDDVPSYPKFLPWCGGAQINERDASGAVVTLLIRYRGLEQAFTTRNEHVDGHGIDISLVSGPFSKLRGKWRFLELREGACKVELTLDFTFSNILLEKLVGPVFQHIATTFIDSFIKRARALYG
jgi:ribosome-associated toxin RatA of RatAB toxin-antitoxin module